METRPAAAAADVVHDRPVAGDLGSAKRYQPPVVVSGESCGVSWVAIGAAFSRFIPLSLAREGGCENGTTRSLDCDHARGHMSRTRTWGTAVRTHRCQA